MTIPKKVVYIVGSLILVLIIAGASFFIYNQVQIKKEHDAKIAKAAAEKLAIKHKKEKFNYNYKFFKEDAIELALGAESVGDKFYDVWRKAIFEDSVKVGGKTYTDFNKALTAQYAEFAKNNKLSDLENAISSTKSDYKTLEKNVTSDNKSKFDAAKSYYNALMKFVNIAKDPTGNFDTFSDNYNNAKTNYINQRNAIESD